MPEQRNRDEVLVVRGIIDRAGRFRPRRCTSTTFVRNWPRVQSSEYLVKLVDAEGQPIHCESVQVRPRQGCGPGDTLSWRVTAYIALREDATAVVLMHCDLMLWRMSIPQSPRLDVTLARDKVSRDKTQTLRFAFSTPLDGAFLQIVYKWGERQHIVVAVTEPQPSLEIDMSTLPGGRCCRFVVQYSNGLRSAVAATREFPLDQLGPTLTIVKPARGMILKPGQPLELEGQVIDPERPRGPHAIESLLWVVDEKPVGRGMISGVDRLAPGRHLLTLRYEPRHGIATETNMTVTVSRVEGDIPPADEWSEWDEWAEIERSERWQHDGVDPA